VSAETILKALTHPSGGLTPPLAFIGAWAASLSSEVRASLIAIDPWTLLREDLTTWAATDLAALIDSLLAWVEQGRHCEYFFGLAETFEPDLLASVREQYPWLQHVFVDGGYAGEKLLEALKDQGDWTIEIINRSDTAKGFVLLPRRWVVERTFAWLNRNRRLAKDVEATTESAVTWLYIASVKLMSRRLASARATQMAYFWAKSGLWRYEPDSSRTLILCALECAEFARTR